MFLPPASVPSWAALLAVVAAFYVGESVLLLHCNEGVLLAGGGRRWKLAFGMSALAMAGRNLFVPNPLLPHRPLFRLAWQFDRVPDQAGTPAEGRPDWDALVLALRPLGWLVVTLALEQLALFPAALYLGMSDQRLLLLLLAVYATIGAALLWIWRRRTSLGLARPALASLALEALLCPPFAINLVRNLGLRLGAAQDLVAVARRLQTAEDWRATQACLLAQLDEQLALTEPDDPRLGALQQCREGLQCSITK